MQPVARTSAALYLGGDGTWPSVPWLSLAWACLPACLPAWLLCIGSWRDGRMDVAPSGRVPCQPACPALLGCGRRSLLCLPSWRADAAAAAQPAPAPAVQNKTPDPSPPPPLTPTLWFSLFSASSVYLHANQLRSTAPASPRATSIAAISVKILQVSFFLLLCIMAPPPRRDSQTPFLGLSQRVV